MNFQLLWYDWCAVKLAPYSTYICICNWFLCQRCFMMLLTKSYKRRKNVYTWAWIKHLVKSDKILRSRRKHSHSSGTVYKRKSHENGNQIQGFKNSVCKCFWSWISIFINIIILFDITLKMDWQWCDNMTYKTGYLRTAQEILLLYSKMTIDVYGIIEWINKSKQNISKPKKNEHISSVLWRSTHVY